MVFEDVCIVPHPDSLCDILIDDWSDQSRRPSELTLRRVFRQDGEPVRVVFGRFRRPLIVNGNCHIQRLSSFGLHAYVLWKGMLVSTGVIDLPSGCPISYPP